jgi:hypothetical protein
MAEFGISSVEPSGSAATMMVRGNWTDTKKREVNVGDHKAALNEQPMLLW